MIILKALFMRLSGSYSLFLQSLSNIIYSKKLWVGNVPLTIPDRCLQVIMLYLFIINTSSIRWPLCLHTGIVACEINETGSD